MGTISNHDSRVGGPSSFAVSVEGRRRNSLIAAAVVIMLIVAAVPAGRAIAGRLQSVSNTPADAGQAAPAGPIEVGISPPRAFDQAPAADPEPSGDGEPDAPLSITPAETLRLAFFDEPIELLDGETDPDANNSIGINVGGLENVAAEHLTASAVVADLIVNGPAGAKVSVHPGERPGDAVRFTIPGSGRLLVQHLIAPTDDAGRIVVSATDQVEVSMTGLGSYLPADRARAGRFVATDSIRIGSLVTATDGRQLTIDLREALGAASDQVGQVILRINANVGRGGGSITVGSGQLLPWPTQANPDLGMAGTELVTVAPDADGEIRIDYAGGSVLTVDLVGYFTNDAAPESRSGLLVLSEQPQLEIVEATGGAQPFVPDAPEASEGGVGSALPGPAVTTIDVANGSTGGSITFWDADAPVPTDATFALAPDQRRFTTEWFGPDGLPSARVRAPEGAVLHVWTIGSYT